MNPTSYWKDYIIPVIGLVGTLVTVIATWAKDLNSSAHRIRTLDEATKRAVFWDTWSKALAAADPEASLATLTSKVKTEVLAAAESVEKAFHVLAVQQASEAHAIQEHQRSRDSIPRLRRWLLLYKPPRARAWIPRIFFYIYLLLHAVLSIPDGSQRARGQCGWRSGLDRRFLGAVDLGRKATRCRPEPLNSMLAISPASTL